MDPKHKRSVIDEVEDVTESLNEKKCCTDWRGGPERSVDEVEDVTVTESSNEKKCTDWRGGPERLAGAQVDEAEEDVTDSSNEKKCCSDCRTTRTPLWRGGPAGPKSLCNACGIKYNKKRRAQMNGFDKNGRSSKNIKQKGDLKLKMRLTVINPKQPHHHHNHHNHHHHDHDHHHDHHPQQQQQQQRNHQRKRSSYERGKPWWNKLREEEQAAILLMAISCGGSLY